MSHLSAVNLATGWLGMRVDARTAAASMIYAAASLSESKVLDADRPLGALTVVHRPVHMQRTVKCSEMRRETERTCCVESVYSATVDATGRHRAGLAAKLLVSTINTLFFSSLISRKEFELLCKILFVVQLYRMFHVCLCHILFSFIQF